jgi:hypothetical protein
MESVYPIVAIRVNETSWAHIWRLRSRYLGTGYDTYPLIPNQTDPKRVHSIYTTDWYAKLDSTTYYTRPNPYRLMVLLFSWVVTP